MSEPDAPLSAAEDDPEALERGRKLFAGPCDFLKGVVAMEGLPAADRIEICVAGRSNVGKSSLLNALTNRKGLARTSNTPGRTQELNFFDVGQPPQIRLVDMPGYGFAEAPKDLVKRWRFLVNDFLRGRAVLRRAFVLVDSRHGLKPVDIEIMEVNRARVKSYGLNLSEYALGGIFSPEVSPSAVTTPSTSTTTTGGVTNPITNQPTTTTTTTAGKSTPPRVSGRTGGSGTT